MSDNTPTVFNQSAELSLESIGAGLTNTLQNAPTVQSQQGKKYLKLDGPNRFVLGRDKEVVPADAEFVVASHMFTHGYVAWHGGSPEFQQMIPVAKALSTITLPTNVKAKNGIEDARGMVLGSLDYFAGDMIEFTTNSRGGREAIEGLMQAVNQKVQAGDAKAFPVIILKTDGYVHKEHGPITKPVFEIVDWMTMQEATENTRPEEGDPEATGEPAAAAEPAPEPEPKPEPEAEAPPRRKRRQRAA